MALEPSLKWSLIPNHLGWYKWISFSIGRTHQWSKLFANSAKPMGMEGTENRILELLLMTMPFQKPKLKSGQESL